MQPQLLAGGDDKERRGDAGRVRLVRQNGAKMVGRALATPRLLIFVPPTCAGLSLDRSTLRCVGNPLAQLLPGLRT